MMTTNDTTPRSWIGCLACCNAGHLVGGWFPGTEAGDVTPEQLHALDVFWIDTREIEGGAQHEELWVMDHEGYHGMLDGPHAGECSPAEAQTIAEFIDELGDEIDAFAAWRDDYGTASLDDETVETFREAFAGEWDDLEDYAHDFAEDVYGLSMIDGPGAVLTRYFDYAALARDLELGGDVWTSDAPGGGVYVFRTV